MKNIEKLALVVIVLMILSWVTPWPIQILANRLVDIPNKRIQYSVLMSAMAFMTYLYRYLFHIGVGIWLFVLAKREKGTPLLWLLFGLTFGLIAAVLFFLIKTYDAVRSDNVFEKVQTEG